MPNTVDRFRTLRCTKIRGIDRRTFPFRARSRNVLRSYRVSLRALNMIPEKCFVGPSRRGEFFVPPFGTSPQTLSVHSTANDPPPAAIVEAPAPWNTKKRIPGDRFCLSKSCCHPTSIPVPDPLTGGWLACAGVLLPVALERRAAAARTPSRLWAVRPHIFGVMSLFDYASKSILGESLLRLEKL